MFSWRKWIWCAVAGFVIVGCGQTTRPEFAAAAAELPAAQAEAKRLGLPLTGADLEPNPPVAPAENAAPLLREAFAKLKEGRQKHSDWRKTLETAVSDPTPANLEAARPALAAIEPALTLATQAAAKPRVDFQRNWRTSEPWNVLFPEYADMRELVIGLAARGTLRARQGDTAGALADFRAGHSIARLAGSEPTLISGLVQAAADAILVRGMERAATARPRDAGFLGQLQTAAAKQAAHPMDLAHALRGEVYVGFAGASNLDAFSELHFAGPTTPGGAQEDQAERRAIMTPGVPKSTLSEAYQARSLQAWNEVFRDEAARRDVLRLSKRLVTTMENYSREGDPTLTLNRIMFPIFEPTGNAFVRREASLATFQGLMAVLRFRIEKGRDPNSLAEAGFTKTDPFSGEPYRLKIAGDEVRVYSVGPDGTDEGGRERARDESTPYDFPSIYPRR